MIKIGAAFLILFFASGCSDYQGSRLQQELKAITSKLESLFQRKQVQPPEEKQAPAEVIKENSELLYEMLTVVFDIKEPADKTDFTSLVSSLNQGASLEGIYRGLIMGAHYRGLESQSAGASPAALKFFALELAGLQMEMKNPTVFQDADAKKPAEIEFPDGSEGAESAASAPRGSPKKEELALELLKKFLGASPFTLKRVLSEEALKRMNEFITPDGKPDRDAFANWYAQFAVRMATLKMDFGLPERNNPDLDFHLKWAKRMSEDRVQWEVLNRLHRAINSISKSN